MGYEYKTEYKNRKGVVQYTLDYEYVKTWATLVEASRHFGTEDSSKISQACRGIIPDAYGFKWEFENVALSKRDETKINGEVPPPATYKDIEKCRDGYTNDFPRFARRQFSLREYSKYSNREVMTRCGWPVTILSTNVKSEGERLPVLGLIKLPNGFERVQLWTTEGFCDPNEAEKFDQDLYMRPVEKVGWANIKIGEDNKSMSLGSIYDTKKDAVLAKHTDKDYATARVVWYE